jgi:RNA polymerase sigma-70 factor (ECF subfamily)
MSLQGGSLDEQVRGLLGQGDVRAAATEAIQALSGPVLGYLRATLRDEDDVADASSTWAEHVWRGLPAFEWRSSLRTWALRIACNVALNLRAQAHRRHERRFDTGEASALIDSIRSSSAARTVWQERALFELRRELTPEEQTLLFLRKDQELSWEEVADILSAAGKRVDAGTASKRYERLKDRLRKLARERGLVK